MTVLAQFVDAVTETAVRLLRQGEYVPLDTGFTQLDPDWTWVQLEDGVITAVLLASPCHGVVQFVRLVGTPRPKLLRCVVRDCLNRGYSGYMSWFNLSQPKEGQLIRVLERGGGTIRPEMHLCVYGELGKLRMW